MLVGLVWLAKNRSASNRSTINRSASNRSANNRSANNRSANNRSANTGLQATALLVFVAAAAADVTYDDRSGPGLGPKTGLMDRSGGLGSSSCDRNLDR